MLDKGKYYTMHNINNGVTFDGLDFGAKFSVVYQLGRLVLFHKPSIGQWIGRGGIRATAPALYVLGQTFNKELFIIECVEPGKNWRAEKSRLIRALKTMSKEMGYTIEPSSVFFPELKNNEAQ